MHAKATCPPSLLPKVDVCGPLRVERDQFGRPTVIGTPKRGPQHGPGSYWYQVGRKYGQAEAQSRFAFVVYSYLQNTGRLAEYAGDGFVGSDVNARRVTFTQEQFSQQIEEGLQSGKIPQDVIDVLEGLHQGYLDHIAKIEQGEEPLPAEFDQEVGILYWWWQERATAAPSTFTVTNFATGREYLSQFTGSAGAAIFQLINFFQLLSAVGADPTGGVEANLIFDDVLGIGSTSRFTIAEGDTSGRLCPLNRCKKLSRKRNQQAANYQGSSSLTPNIHDRIQKSLQALQAKNDGLRRLHSGAIAISSKLTANGSTLLFGNPQVEQGFDFGPPGELSAKSWITPQGSVHSPGLVPAAFRSGDSGYTIISEEQTAFYPVRDALWEDIANLNLLSENTVPGGLSHSTIFIRNLETGELDSVVVDIYQGKDRKSLELDVRDFAEEGYVLMQRFPCNFDDEASVVLKWIATAWGLVPFASIEEFINELLIGNWWYNIGIGIDTEGNIFSFTSPVLNTKPGVTVDRTMTQDATGGFFSELAARPMPAPSDDDYICSGPRLVKNPPCGTLIGWNDSWTSTDINILGSLSTSVGIEATRSGAFYQFVQDRLNEKGKLCFEDIRDAYEVYQVSRNRRAIGGTASAQNQGADPFPFSLRKDFFKALDAQGLHVGLTKKEIRRVKELLGCSYDGRSFPNVDIQDKIGGSNFDGRWVLSQIWQSVVARNLWNAAVSDPGFRAAASTNLGLAALETVPTGDWSIANVNQSRVSTVGIASSMASINIMIRALGIGPDLGNTTFYPWAQNAGLTSKKAIQKFIAQALLDALTLQATETNSDLVDPETGRANLDLIQDNGIPLHPGWGRGQRPTTLPGQLPYVTLFLKNNILLYNLIPAMNAVGQTVFAERTGKGELAHLQTRTQLGYASLITKDENNGETILTIQPHGTDQAIYTNGNFATDEIPFDICKKKCPKKMRK